MLHLVNKGWIHGIHQLPVNITYRAYKHTENGHGDRNLDNWVC